MAVKSFGIALLVFLLALLYTASGANGRRGSGGGGGLMGEHQVRQLRPTRGFKEMELAAARNFGKRAINMHVVNSILMEWIALESKMKALRQQGRNLPPLESVMPVLADIAAAAAEEENISTSGSAVAAAPGSSDDLLDD